MAVAGPRHARVPGEPREVLTAVAPERGWTSLRDERRWRACRGRDSEEGTLYFGSHGLFLEFVDSNDRELRRIQPLIDEANELEAEIAGPQSDDEIRERFAADPRRDPRGRRPRRAVRGRARPTRTSSAAASSRRPAASASRRTVQAALDDVLPEVFAMGREAMRRTLGHAPLRRPADRRHRPPPGQDRRDEDRRGQDLRRRPSPRSSTRSPAAASTSSPSTTTSPGATRSGWARSSTSSG